MRRRDATQFHCHGNLKGYIPLDYIPRLHFPKTNGFEASKESFTLRAPVIKSTTEDSTTRLSAQIEK